MLRGIRVDNHGIWPDRIHLYFMAINADPVIFRWKCKMGDPRIAYYQRIMIEAGRLIRGARDAAGSRRREFQRLNLAVPAERPTGLPFRDIPRPSAFPMTTVIALLASNVLLWGTSKTPAHLTSPSYFMRDPDGLRCSQRDMYRTRR